MHASTFSNLPLSPEILQNLESLGYVSMTPIQEKSLPLILNNQDVIAQAATGSGKTAAFGLGLMDKIDAELRKAQSLVICPTRELAEQISKELQRLARRTPNIRVLVLTGGKPIRAQIESLKNGAHIIVGTPGRLQDHISKNTLPLDDIKVLVLDEADRMLDMGFYDDMMAIIKTLPKKRQTCLFSATYQDNIKSISRQIQNKPIEILLESKESAPDITQIAYTVDNHEKPKALISFLSHFNAKSIMVFCKLKSQCDETAKDLRKAGFHALALHGDLEQRERDEVLIQFSNRSCGIIVATDVASRGLDIKDVELIINYDLPNSIEIYVHRIGRTGRAGQSGTAISFVPASEDYMLENIAAFTQTPIKRNKLPSGKKSNHSNAGLPIMCTFALNAGKKNKLRPGDILGALTGDGGLAGKQIGKIDVFDNYAYVAVERAVGHKVLAMRDTFKIKGRAFKIRPLNKF